MAITCGRRVPLGPAIFNGDVLTLDPAKLPQRPQECVKNALDGLAGRGAQIADAEDFRGLLHLGGERCGKKCRSSIQEVPAVDLVHALIAPRRTAGKSTLDPRWGSIRAIERPLSASTLLAADLRLMRRGGWGDELP